LARSPSFGPVGCGVDFFSPDEAEDQMFPKASLPDFPAGLVFPRPAKALGLAEAAGVEAAVPEVVEVPVADGTRGTEVK